MVIIGVYKKKKNEFRPVDEYHTLLYIEHIALSFIVGLEVLNPRGPGVNYIKCDVVNFTSTLLE